MLDYASNPLVEELPDGDEAIVRHVLSTPLWWNEFQVSALMHRFQ